jgi:hypothetical protein
MLICGQSIRLSRRQRRSRSKPLPHLAQDYQRHMGKVLGDGHCVALVRQCAGLPPTVLWRRGDPVRGSNCAPGTVIATFDADGRYGNHTDGRSHAAILLTENPNDLQVIDQWLTQPVHTRIIRSRNGSGDAVNDADRYSVVEVMVST